MDGILRPTGRNSVERELTLFGLELYALAEQFFELDPDWPKLATTGQGQPRAARESTSRKGMFVRCPD
jgi:hypothetical protein